MVSLKLLVLAHNSEDPQSQRLERPLNYCQKQKHMKILIERNRNAMASQANSINPRVSFIDTEQELVCDDNACHKSPRRKFEGRKHKEESWDGSKLDRNVLMVRACKWDP